jgi:histidinol phosphatase-like PHP family hydrolase
MSARRMPRGGPGTQPDSARSQRSPSNTELSELLARGADDQDEGSQRQRAMRRASRAALGWDVRAADVLAAGQPLSSLTQVGPWLAQVIEGWVRAGTAAPAPPPLRAGFVARADALATVRAAPKWHRVVRGDLQMHTLSSDGHATLETMARRCVELGYSHMAVTDHSQGLRIANGLTDARRADQAVEVRGLNAALAGEGVDFSILHGIEMDIAPDGTGDTDPASLGSLGFVLGAFHSKLRLVDDQTDRYLRALANPNVDVLAHPRGRMYNRRVGLQAQWDLVFEAAAEYGVALEVDAYPDRQDLDVDLLRRAASAGAWVAVDTDAHHPADLDAMPLGVAALIRAGVPRDQVINAMCTDELREWIAWRRGRAAERARRALIRVV